MGRRLLVPVSVLSVVIFPLDRPLRSQIASENSAGRGAPATSGSSRTRKKVLAWGDTMTAYQHVSVSHALATIDRLGRESGAFDTYLRTDSQLITKHAFAEGV